MKVCNKFTKHKFLQKKNVWNMNLDFSWMLNSNSKLKNKGNFLNIFHFKNQNVIL